MADVEHKIRLVAEYDDKGIVESLKKAQAQVLSFGDAAKKAGKDLKETQDTGTKSAKSLSDVFGSLKASTLAAAAGVAVVTTAIGKIIKEITDAEDATRRFGFALSSSGITSKQAVSNFQAFAKSIQSTTRYSDEAVLSLGGLLTSMGVGFGDLQGASKAAIELAARFGLTIDEAGSAIARSFSGSAREVGRFVPELRGVSEESLKAGKAVDVINKKFAGSAALDSESLSGSIAMAKNSLSEIAESMNVVLGPAIQGTIAFLKDAAKAALDFSDAIGLSDKTVSGSKLDQFKAQMQELVQEQKKLQESASGPDFIIGRGGAFRNQEKVDAEKRLLEVTKQIAAFKKDILDLESKSTTEIAVQVKHQKETKSALEAQTKLEQVSANYAKDKVDLMKDQDKLHGLAITRMMDLKTLSDEELANLQKKLELMQRQDEFLQTGLGSSVASGSTSGLASGAATMFGSTGPQAAIVAGITELVIHAGELPGKIDGMISGLAKGIGEGIPMLINYLADDFLPNLINGLLVAIGGLVKNLPGMAFDAAKLGIRTGAAFVTGGLSEVGGAVLGGLFGDGPKYFQDFTKAVSEKLDFKAFAKSIDELTKSIQSAGSSFRTTSQRLGISSADLLSSRNDRLSAQGAINGDIVVGKKGDVRIKDADKFAAHIEDLKNAVQTEATAIVDNANLRIDKIKEEKQALIDLNDQALVPIRATLERLRGLRNAVSNAFGGAISIVSGALSSSTETSGSLLSQFNSASGEAKGALGQQLASALQTQFADAQNLAKSGAISGEELKRIQGDILAQLQTAQASATSEIDQLIASNERQEASIVAASEQLRADMNSQIEGVKAAALAQLDRLDAILNQLKSRSFRGFAAGTSFVQETGMALVHKGESIQPYGSKGAIVININGVPAGGATKDSLVKAVRDILNQNLGNVRGAIQRANG